MNNPAFASGTIQIDPKYRVTSLTAVFPAFNEEANIRRTVQAARLVLPSLAESWEIIVVDDGSRDATSDILDQLANEYADVHAIHHEKNEGYGAALKSGICAAHCDYIFFSDSDGQFDLGELSQFMEWSASYDIVAGYRARRNDPPYRMLNAWGWKILVRAALGVKIRDIDCAFKLFRRRVFHKVQIRSVGAMVNTEILAQADRFGMSIKQLPVSHYPRHLGHPTGAKLRVIFKAFRELFGLWFKLRKISHEQNGLYAANQNPTARPSRLRRPIP
jgi:glycosyltransferase involved in cell wall biosynthesis